MSTAAVAIAFGWVSGWRSERGGVVSLRRRFCHQGVLLCLPDNLAGHDCLSSVEVVEKLLLVGGTAWGHL